MKTTLAWKKLIEEDEQEQNIRLEIIRKSIDIAEKELQKYLIFVVVLPLIGAIGLSILGALNYKHNFQFGSINSADEKHLIDSQELSGIEVNDGWRIIRTRIIQLRL